MKLYKFKVRSKTDWEPA